MDINLGQTLTVKSKGNSKEVTQHLLSPVSEIKSLVINNSLLEAKKNQHQQAHSSEYFEVKFMMAKEHYFYNTVSSLAKEAPRFAEIKRAIFQSFEPNFI